MRLQVLLTSVLATLVLAACTPQSKDQWVGYRNADLGISFSHPASYIPDEVVKEDLQFGRGTIPIQHVYLRRENIPETAVMEVLRSDDPRIVGYFTSDHPFEDIMLGNKVLKKFHWDGLGEPIGYVLRERPWVAIIFAFWPDRMIEQRAVETMEVK